MSFNFSFIIFSLETSRVLEVIIPDSEMNGDKSELRTHIRAGRHPITAKVLSEPKLPPVCVNVINVSGLAGKCMKRYLLSFKAKLGNGLWPLSGRHCGR